MSAMQIDARVQVTLEVDVGAWNGECTADYITEQAQREGVQRVMQALQGRCRVIGEPVVTIVMATKKPPP